MGEGGRRHPHRSGALLKMEVGFIEQKSLDAEEYLATLTSNFIVLLTLLQTVRFYPDHDSRARRS